MARRQNVGGIDRWIRLVLGVTLILVGILLAGGAHGDASGIALTVAGVASLVSALTGYCPLYVPLGFSTAKRGSAWCTCLPMRCLGARLGRRDIGEDTERG